MSFLFRNWNFFLDIVIEGVLVSEEFEIKKASLELSCWLIHLFIISVEGKMTYKLSYFQTESSFKLLF